MGEKKTTPIVVNDVEYTFEDMTPTQQALVSHCNDLDRKIKSAQFNLISCQWERTHLLIC